MTHDELLARIKDSFYVCGDDCQFCRKDNASWFALRAVVEIERTNETHELIENHTSWNHGWDMCLDAVYEAIEKELG